MTPEAEAWSLNHWIAREVSKIFALDYQFVTQCFLISIHTLELSGHIKR